MILSKIIYLGLKINKSFYLIIVPAHRYFIVKSPQFTLFIYFK